MRIVHDTKFKEEMKPLIKLAHYFVPFLMAIIIILNELRIYIKHLYFRERLPNPIHTNEAYRTLYECMGYTLLIFWPLIIIWIAATMSGINEHKLNFKTFSLSSIVFYICIISYVILLFAGYPIEGFF